MIQDFYIRFYRVLHIRKVCIFLAYCARFLFFIKFLICKWFLRECKISYDIQDAEALLEQKSPPPVESPDYSTARCDGETDLSIIVPVYNHVDVLERCIESLLKQKTSYRYEIILVDDGSSDGAQDVIDHYRDNSNVIIIHQKNAGIAAARNKGLCHAKGRYFMFVDCDDYVHSDIVDCLLAKAFSEDLDLVMCAHALVKTEGGRIVSRIPYIYPKENLLGYGDADRIMNYPGLPWGKVYKRELFDGVRFFPGCWYEDTIIHGLIFTQCKSFAYIPEVKYEYQWHETNFSHVQGGKKQQKAIDRYWIIKKIVNQYEELGLEKNSRFFVMLLTHLSEYYYPSISNLSDEIVHAMFVVGRELLLNNRNVDKIKIPYMLRQTERAIISGNINLWKLCSVSR